MEEDFINLKEQEDKADGGKDDAVLLIVGISEKISTEDGEGKQDQGRRNVKNAVGRRLFHSPRSPF